MRIIFADMKIKWLFILLIVTVFSACKDGKPKEKIFKGYVIIEKDYSTFTNCETDKTYWLEDKTGEIETHYKSLTNEAYKEVYFELKADLLPPSTKGVSSSFDNVMAVSEVVKYSAKASEQSCVRKNGKSVFKCFGTNPNWSLGFGRDTKFTSEFPKDTVVFFPLKEPELRDSANMGRVFYYYIGNENYQDIQVIVTEQPCREGKKFNRFTSKVIFGGVEYKGCATLKMIDDEKYSTD